MEHDSMNASANVVVPIVSWVVILLTFGFFLLLHKRYYAAQYAYFLRVPLIFSILAWGLPFLAFTKTGAAVVGNWFDLKGWDFFFVALLATLNAWALMFQFGMIWESSPLRTGIPFAKEDLNASADASANPRNHLWLWLQNDGLGQKHVIPVPPMRLLVFFLLFAGPMLVTAICKSSFSWDESFALSLGVIAAYGFWGISRYSQFQQTVDIRAWVRDWFFSKLRSLTLVLGLPAVTVNNTVAFAWKKFLHYIAWVDVVKGLDRSDQKSLTFSAVNSRSYFMAALLLYALVGFAFYPASGNALRLPPVFYILTMFLVISYIASFLTLWFDIYRVPVLSLVAFLVIAVPGDHYFSAPKVTPPTAAPAISLSQDSQIVVAASGGGITASYWTSLVLAKLHRDYPDSFSVNFLSAVSGGSVAAIFYSAGLAAGISDDKVLDDFTFVSGQSSLGEIGWGLSYPDLWRRILNIPFSYDRAHAIEARWRNLMDEFFGPQERTLKKSTAISGGTVLALNAVVAETGQRMIFTDYPLFGDPKEREAFSENGALTPSQRCDRVLGQGGAALLFSDIFPGRDIALETAARLSATFPYVTPVARIEPSDVVGLYPENCPVANFHYADGGYLDNWGVSTALDYLATIDGSRSDHGKPHLLIEIRATGSAAAPTIVSPGASAPIRTMMNVRSSSQIERNERLLGLTQKLRPDRLERVVFELAIDAPLSWHLSDSDREKIDGALQSAGNRAQFKKVGCFLQQRSSHESQLDDAGCES